MAARIHLSHDAKTRERIKTSQLINRLQSFAFGTVNLTPGQTKAIEVLLKKTLPDLTSIALTGGPDGSPPLNLLVSFVSPA
jgi:hypothetical protein